MESIFTNLLATPTESSSKKIQPFPARKPGVFGPAFASYGVSEEQARGSLHMHIVTWGSFPPRFLQQSATCPHLVKLVAASLDTMFSATLDSEVHIESLLQQFKGGRGGRSCLYLSHDPLTHPNEFKEDVDRSVTLSNIHIHTQTCHKPPTGRTHCRLARPAPIMETTGCVQIVPMKQDNEPTSFTVLPEILPPDPFSQLCRNIYVMPVCAPDRRLVMWELRHPLISSLRADKSPESADMIEDEKATYLRIPEHLQHQLNELTPVQHQRLFNRLTKRNGLGVEYNPVTSALLGCNTAVYILGSDCQVSIHTFMINVTNNNSNNLVWLNCYRDAPYKM